MAIVATDDLTPPQNNAVLVFRLIDGQWFTLPHVMATAFAVARTRNDENELYTGQYGNLILREDISELDNSRKLDTGQVNTEQSSSTSIFDSDKSWEVDEWVGTANNPSLVFLHTYATPNHIQMAIIESNNEQKIMIEAGTIVVIGEEAAVYDTWVNEAHAEYTPVADDYYFLLQEVQNSKHIYYKSPKLPMGSLDRLKQYIRFFTRVFADGTITVRWQIDDSNDGVITWDLSQGDTFLGVDNYGRYDLLPPAANTLLWQATFDEYLSKNMIAGAKGRYIQIEIELTTSTNFQLGMLGLNFKTHGGQGWG